MQTAIGNIDGQYIGKFKKSSGSYYYETDLSAHIIWPSILFVDYYQLIVQRYSAGKWASVGSERETFIRTESGSTTASIKIKHASPTAGTYRLYVASTEYTTGSYSPSFSISGTLQTPKLAVAYSASSQKYKKSGVRLTITTDNSLSGTAKIYDNGKLLKALAVKNGKGNYTLPKRLKKGNHKIKVTFTVVASLKSAYVSKTSPVKVIKVK